MLGWANGAENPRKTAKQEVQNILKNLPEDASLEDIQYHIYVCQKVARGEADADAGRTISQAEVEDRLSKWLGK